MAGGVQVGLVAVDDVYMRPYAVQPLGDLRALIVSITQHGLLQPIVVERHGGGLQLRIGRRRLAAARLAGLGKVPAVIYPVALEERLWLLQAIQDNSTQRQLDEADRVRAVHKLRSLGCSWATIGQAFGVAPRTVSSWVLPEKGPHPTRSARAAAGEGTVGTPMSFDDQVERRVRVIAELEVLLDTDTEQSVAMRVGYPNPLSLARALYRWGRPDLACRFERRTVVAA